MSIRTIKYSVTESGISPAARQFGGIQGEHNVTKVIFDLSSELHAKIWEHMCGQGAKIVYRFDGIDGVGGKISTDTTEIGFEDSAPEGVRSFEYLLSHDITKEGGTVQVFLIITSMLNDETQAELYNFPATLYLKERPDGTLYDGEDYESVSTLAETAKGAAQRAEDSADNAKTSAEAAKDDRLKTEEAQRALEEGTTFVFLGGDAGSRFTVDIAVDSEFSQTSENPVQNRTVFERFEEQNFTDAQFDETLNTARQDIKANAENHTALESRVAAIEEDNKALNNRAYIVEYGTSDIWTYEKWSNGVAKLWGIATLGTFGDTRHIYKIQSLPFAFTNYPVANMTLYRAEASTQAQGAIVLSDVYVLGATTIRLSMINGSVTLKDGDSVQVNVTLVGRWKEAE